MRVTSDALRVQLQQRLEAVGVHAIDVPAGTRFDASTHRGIQAAPAASPEQDGIVAACDRAGWRDGSTVIRPPEVVVYRWESS